MRPLPLSRVRAPVCACVDVYAGMYAGSLESQRPVDVRTCRAHIAFGPVGACEHLPIAWRGSPTTRSTLRHVLVAASLLPRSGTIVCRADPLGVNRERGPVGRAL